MIGVRKGITEILYFVLNTPQDRGNNRLMQTQVYLVICVNACLCWPAAFYLRCLSMLCCFLF